MLAFAMFMSVCGAVMVMSSTYVVSCTECVSKWPSPWPTQRTKRLATILFIVCKYIFY